MLVLLNLSGVGVATFSTGEEFLKWALALSVPKVVFPSWIISLIVKRKLRLHMALMKAHTNSPSSELEARSTNCWQIHVLRNAHILPPPPYWSHMRTVATPCLLAILIQNYTTAGIIRIKEWLTCCSHAYQPTIILLCAAWSPQCCRKDCLYRSLLRLSSHPQPPVSICPPQTAHRRQPLGDFFYYYRQAMPSKSWCTPQQMVKWRLLTPPFRPITAPLSPSITAPLSPYGYC